MFTAEQTLIDAHNSQRDTCTWLTTKLNAKLLPRPIPLSTEEAGLRNNSFWKIQTTSTTTGGKSYDEERVVDDLKLKARTQLSAAYDPIHRSARPSRVVLPALPWVAVVEVEQHGAEAPWAPGVLPGQHHVHHAPRAPGQDHGGRRAAASGRRSRFRASLGRHARTGRRRGGRRGRRHTTRRRGPVAVVASRPRRRRRSAAPCPGQAQPEELQLRRLAVVSAHPRSPLLWFLITWVC
jgi:hypothetical protein